VLFQKDGYSGSVIDLDGVAPNAATLKIGRDSQNIFEPILAGELEVIWYATKDVDTLEIATDSPRTWRVIVQDNAAAEIWRGWVEPESYQEQYFAPPYQVSIIATDGLNDLKTAEFPIADGKDSLWNYLTQALENTDLGLGYKESVNIYADEMDSAAADSPFVQADVQGSTWTAIAQEPNAFQVVDAILRPFGARIYQYAGSWVIENIQGKRATYIERTFDSLGAYVSQATVNPQISLSAAANDFKHFIGKSASINTIPRIPQAKVFFRNSPSAPSNVITGFADDDDWTDANNLAEWSKVNSPTVNQRLVNREFDGQTDKYVLEITGRQTSLSDDKHILSNDLPLVQSTFETLNLSFWYQMNWPTLAILGGRPILYVQIELDAGAKKYYWRGEWVEDISVHLRIDPSNRREWKRFETSISSIPESGDLRIRVFTLVKSGSDSNTWVQLGGWNVVTAEQSELDVAFAVDEGTLTGEFNRNPYELEVYLADGPVTTRGGVLSVDNVLTTRWNRRGETDDLELKRLYLLQFLSLHQRPSIRIQGTLHQRGAKVLPTNTISEGGRVYIMNAYVVGLSDAIGSVIYRELITADANPTYTFRLSEIGPIDLDFGIRVGLPGDRDNFIPGIPQIEFDLNGDVSGAPGTNLLNPSAIVEKTVLDFTGLDSSKMVINAVPDTPDAEAMTKLSARDFVVLAHPEKANPTALDAFVISDDDDSGELKTVIGIHPAQIRQAGATDGQALVWNDEDGKWEAGTVAGGGSKWTEVTGNLFRNSRVTIGTNSILGGVLAVKGSGTNRIIRAFDASDNLQFDLYDNGRAHFITSLTVGVDSSPVASGIRINGIGTGTNNTFQFRDGSGNIKIQFRDNGDNTYNGGISINGVGISFIPFEVIGRTSSGNNAIAIVRNSSNATLFRINDSGHLNHAGNMRVGVLNSAASARIHVNGAGTGTGGIILAENSANTRRLLIRDDGRMFLSGGIATSAPSAGTFEVWVDSSGFLKLAT
jgi:hypothetical protein